MKRPTPCERCRLASAVVGVGEPPTWLCIDCAEVWLEDVGRTLRQVRDQFNRIRQARLS